VVLGLVVQEFCGKGGKMTWEHAQTITLKLFQNKKKKLPHYFIVI
jgi:hypothetical protein